MDIHSDWALGKFIDVVNKERGGKRGEKIHLQFSNRCISDVGNCRVMSMEKAY